MLRHSQHLGQYCAMLTRTLTPVQGYHPLQRTVFKLMLILKAPFTSCVCVCVFAYMYVSVT